MTQVNQAKVAILATHGYEKSELFEPKRKLEESGARVSVISPETGAIKSWDNNDWGESVDVDLSLAESSISEFDALVLPGGQINPDVLRLDPDAVGFVRDFYNTGKPVAAICHAPWLLIEAGVLKGRKVTSYGSIATDVKNAGAKWEDSPVVVDNGLVTSRSPADLEAFCSKLIEEIEERRHERA